ncbi:MAG: hypothetical protein OXF52_03835 [Candidatus Dadabacteria bacterium]|nr:hypothetical protein [Candidatus Dadabacteria bacterium]
MATAFELRERDDYISTNWLEYYEKQTSMDKQLDCIRSSLQNSNFTIRERGMFAVINVGQAKKKISELLVKHLPEENNLSHAGISSTKKDENRQFTLELSSIVQSENLFPALKRT